MWTTVSALGDRGTTCAIVGGIVGAHVGQSGLPAGMARASRAAPSLDRVRAATISDRLQASPSDTPTAAHQRPGGGPRARAVGARVPSAPSASRCRPGSGRRRRDAPSLRTRTAGGRRDPAPWRPPRRRGHHSTRQGVFPNRRSGTIASTFPHVQAAPHPCAASLSTGPWTRGPRHRSTGVLYAAASRAAARLPRTSHAESRNGDREANVPSGLRGVRPTHALAGGWLHPRRQALLLTTGYGSPQHGSPRRQEDAVTEPASPTDPGQSRAPVGDAFACVLSGAFSDGPDTTTGDPVTVARARCWG